MSVGMCVFLRVESKGEEKASERERETLFAFAADAVCVLCTRIRFCVTPATSQQRLFSNDVAYI